MLRLWLLDSQLQLACLSHFSHEICHCFSNFVTSHATSNRCLQYAIVCYNDHTTSSLYPSLLWVPLTSSIDSFSCSKSVEFSMIVVEEEPLIMIDLQLSSLQTIANTSQIEGKGSFTKDSSTNFHLILYLAQQETQTLIPSPSSS